jgi:hypothetical protein
MNPAAPHVPADLPSAISSLRRRALAHSALRWVLLGLLGWAVATVGLLAWAKLHPTADVPLVAGALGAGAVAGAGCGWALRQPTVYQVARVADARLGLDERLASALAFAAAPGEMPARLRADALAHAAQHRPAEAYPLAHHRRLVIGTLAVLVVAGGLVASPNPQAAALARQARDGQAVARAESTLKRAEQQLGAASSPQLRRVASELHKALAQLRGSGTPLSALVALSNLTRELANLGSSVSQANQAARAVAGAVGAALAGTRTAAPLSRDLSAGDLAAAASDLRALANELKKLTPAERRALAGALSAASAAGRSASSRGPGNHAQAEGQGATQMAGALGRAAAALASGRLGAAGQALGAAESGASSAARAASLDQQVSAIESALRNAEQQVATQAQADAGASPGQGGGAGGQGQGAGGQGGGSGSGQGSNGATGPGGEGGQGAGGTRPHGGGNSGGGNGGGNGAGSGRGSGLGAGAGDGSGGGSGKSSAGPGQGATGGMGARGGTGRPGSTGAGVPADQILVGGQPGRGVRVTGGRSGNGVRVRTTNYQSVLPSFEKAALQGEGAQALSPADRGLVRSYFSSLGGGK